MDLLEYFKTWPSLELCALFLWIQIPQNYTNNFNDTFSGETWCQLDIICIEMVLNSSFIRTPLDSFCAQRSEKYSSFLVHIIVLGPFRDQVVISSSLFVLSIIPTCENLDHVGKKRPTQSTNVDLTIYFWSTPMFMYRNIRGLLVQNMW